MCEMFEDEYGNWSHGDWDEVDFSYSNIKVEYY